MAVDGGYRGLATPIAAEKKGRAVAAWGAPSRAMYKGDGCKRIVQSPRNLDRK
jgi:hypothetical protein